MKHHPLLLVRLRPRDTADDALDASTVMAPYIEHWVRDHGVVATVTAIRPGDPIPIDPEAVYG